MAFRLRPAERGFYPLFNRAGENILTATGQGILTMLLAGIVLVIIVALVFDWTNGFHDAANAIATLVATRALTPPVALGSAAAMNLLGAFLGTEVASTVGGGVIAAPRGTGGLAVVLAALVGAIVWNLITWRLGLPSSSSHGLIGGLVGAASSCISCSEQVTAELRRVVVLRHGFGHFGAG